MAKEQKKQVRRKAKKKESAKNQLCTTLPCDEEKPKEKSCQGCIFEQIGFFYYCHERIDELKSSIYQRASVIMVILAFVVSAYVYILNP